MFEDIDEIPAQLVEVSDTEVVFELCIDLENQTYEQRSFDKRIIEGLIPFEQGALAMIKITTTLGRVIFEIVDGKNIIDKNKYFPEINFSEICKDIVWKHRD